MADFRPCGVVPTYDNPRTIERTVEGLRAHVPVLVVDDGSHAPARDVVAALGRAGKATVLRLPANGGKGAAVRAGLKLARRLGYTNALQVDADGQHELTDIPRFLAAAAARPDALVLGAPVFDATAPRARLAGRKVTILFVHLETGGVVIQDPMCGFRVYPLAETLRVLSPGWRMEFDIEVAVRLVWRGVPVVNLPTRVRYLSREQGGVSHFRALADNVRLSWMHTRLCVGAFMRLARLPRLAGSRP